jgi:hypothetical protein
MVGSGHLGTPWERMQTENATADWALEPPEPADDGLPLHAASTARRAARTTAGRVRPVRSAASG